MKTYFKGLNGLRFIGAFSVLIGHIELIKYFNGLPNLMKYAFYKNTNGHLGVLLFFVLSGFLITYFLIVEIEHRQKINFKNFYIKRLLRIWPIYYLMIVFAIFVLPTILSLFGENTNIYSYTQIKYYIFFLPNIAKSCNYAIPGAVHLWSIGVEEQFYLIWPILIYIFRKRLFHLFVIIFITFSILPLLVDFIYIRSDYFQKIPDIKKIISAFLSSFKINAMALGGIFAYLHIQKFKFIEILHSSFYELCIFSTTFILWSLGINIGTFSDEIYSILFACIIYTTATKNKPIINLENKIFNFLGKISYGIYVYHWVILMITLKLINLCHINFHEKQILANCILYVTSITFTILISYISYKYIEAPIMNMKKKFNID